MIFNTFDRGERKFWLIRETNSLCRKGRVTQEKQLQ